MSDIITIPPDSKNPPDECRLDPLHAARTCSCYKAPLTPDQKEAILGLNTGHNIVEVSDDVAEDELLIEQ